MKNEAKEDRLFGLYILLGVVFLFWIVSILVIRWEFNDWSTRGTFGDSFGAINSLFSGLALGGIIYTIFLQKKELALQREELSETRNEFKVQNITLKLQRFENTFFSLLTLHHQIVDSIDVDIQSEKVVKKMITSMTDPREFERVTLRGRDVFKYRYENLKKSLESKEEDFNDLYLKSYELVQTDFGHYFRNLYRIIKLVDATEFHSHEELNSDPDAVNYVGRLKYSLPNHNTRYRYISMIRAQLSDYELLWLFYNCLSTNGIEKFKPLIEEYCLLKNMPQDKLHDKGFAKKYSERAFERK